jgi:hypothetical protein
VQHFDVGGHVIRYENQRRQGQTLRHDARDEP